VSFNTLCRVLIGCYDDGIIWRLRRNEFQYPLSGLDRLLPSHPRRPMGALLCFNTLCRVLIGCYADRLQPRDRPLEVSIPSVGS